MKLQFKQQSFQADAAKAVVDVFAGQPNLAGSSRIDGPIAANQLLVPELCDSVILDNVQCVQRRNHLAPSEKLEGRSEGFNLTIEMETGVGKTYTYIKTMYELNRAYGWRKFIVVVPSIAIREGVYKSFEMTRDHFVKEYGKRIRYFIYHSSRMSMLDQFAADPSISVMIINSQAFGTKEKDARRIYLRLDEFRSRRPIDLIAATNPILVIDEPQSVEGKQTKESLKDFHPMITLRYSATHKSGSIFNMVYRLDAVDAYRKCLVKKIAVKGISEVGSAAGDSYLYLEGLRLSKSNPAAILRYDVRMPDGTLMKRSRRVKEGDDLFGLSNGLEEYRDRYVIRRIDGRDQSLEFQNGIRLYAGDMTGDAGEEQLRRIQIRETILSHIERERQLYGLGIKVLSLFFIDEVANYRQYDPADQPVNGKYAEMFEEEYMDIVGNAAEESAGGSADCIWELDYRDYLASIPVRKTHAGYFSVDGRGRMVNPKVGRRETTSDDVSAYELIMKNKELLLERDPEKSPVRFIFSHSALREGWDNPNVFQICTLKQSGSEVRKRQEVGRGLRLSVNQSGERMDASVLGDDVHRVNVLTVIASESYDSFARGLQEELAEETAGDNGGESARTSDVFESIRPENARSASSCDPEKELPRLKRSGKQFRDETALESDGPEVTADELVRSAISSLNAGLRVSKAFLQVETGTLDPSGTEREVERYDLDAAFISNVKYDLIGTLTRETGFTRRDIVAILMGIRPEVFQQFQANPEEFMAKAARLLRITAQKLCPGCE